MTHNRKMGKAIDRILAPMPAAPSLADEMKRAFEDIKTETPTHFAASPGAITMLKKAMKIGTPIDFRQIVLDRLTALGKSVNWLQTQMGVYGSKHPHIHRFIKGKKALGSVALGQVCGILGLKVKPARAGISNRRK